MDIPIKMHKHFSVYFIAFLTAKKNYAMNRSSNNKNKVYLRDKMPLT